MVGRYFVSGTGVRYAISNSAFRLKGMNGHIYGVLSDLVPTRINMANVILMTNPGTPNIAVATRKKILVILFDTLSSKLGVTKEPTADTAT